MAAESITTKLEKDALTGTWDGEKRHVSLHANNLQQLDNVKKIPPSGWKCEKCDLTNNLWLNLTDGSILCGRRFFDGSGGNDHAIQHYNECGYPLAVKLGIQLHSVFLLKKFYYFSFVNINSIDSSSRYNNTRWKR